MSKIFQIAINTTDPICALDPLLLIPRIEYIKSIISHIQSSSEQYTVTILDMKNFHLINDVFNYNTGDEVLSNFISTLRSILPKNTITLRFRHGDEFLFFLPIKKDETEKIFYEYNKYCENHNFLTNLDGTNFLVSFRYATIELTDSVIDIDNVLLHAESRLRQVKGQGSTR